MRRALLEDDFWADSNRRYQSLRRQGSGLDWPVMLASGVSVIGPAALLKVGAWSALAEGVLVLTEDGSLLPYFGCWRRAPIVLREHVQVGTGSILCPGLTLGPRAAVGVYSVVTDSVAEDAVVVGKPAQVVGSFKRFAERRARDVAEHPRDYPEVFPYARTPAPWGSDQPTLGEAWVMPTSTRRVSRLRRRLQDAYVHIQSWLQESDPIRASEQRVHLLRRQGYAIGDHTYVDPLAFVDARSAAVALGKHCYVGPYAAVIAHDGFCANYTGRVRVDPVRVLDGCSIGAGALILPGVTIGPASVVAAGSTVVRDVPPHTVVSGSPARVVSSIEEWVKARQKEAAEQPDQYVPEPRFVSYVISNRDVEGGRS